MIEDFELRHLRTAVLTAPRRDGPPEVAHIDDVFTPETYATILRLFPSDRHAFDAWQSPADGRPRFAAYARRRTFALPRQADRLSHEQREFWTKLRDLLCGPDFVRALLERFEPYARARFGEAAADPAFAASQFVATLVLEMHDAEYYIGPHTDRGEKAFTCVFHIPENDGLDDLGPVLYAPLDPQFTCEGDAHHDPAQFTALETLPYRPNSVTIFARSDALFHGMRAVPAGDVRGSGRRGISLQVWRANARPKDQCAISVTATAPESMEPGERSRMSYALTNRSSLALASSFPNTTQIGYRWFDADGAFVPGSAATVRFPAVLAPGASCDGELAVTAPELPGRYTLRMSVVQEAVAWFDDLDPANGCVATIDVGEHDHVDVFPAWARPGAGFHAIERAGDDAFRWVGADATIALASDRGDVLTFEVESGPGLGAKPFVLSIEDSTGDAVATAVVRQRSRVNVALRHLPHGAALVLRGPSGIAIGDDVRTLNFRVFASAQNP